MRSYVESTKNDLLERLCVSLDQQFDQSQGPPIPFPEWCEQTPVILDGRPFTFERHEYLKEPYQDDHPHIVEEKAAQMGLTSKAMLKVVINVNYFSRSTTTIFPVR